VQPESPPQSPLFRLPQSKRLSSNNPLVLNEHETKIHVILTKPVGGPDLKAYMKMHISGYFFSGSHYMYTDDYLSKK
jgi:hypothetical protein